MKIVIVFALLACTFVSALRPEVLGDRPIEVNPNRIVVEPRNRNNKIINGMNDVKGDHPYQISLRRLGSVWFHTCGGSILHSTAVLTAAHCVDDLSVPTASYKVVAGEYDMGTSESSEQTIEVASITIHPSWDASAINNDVAVIRLKSAIIFDAYAQPITLADKLPAVGTPSTVTGWGWTQYEPPIRPNIMQVLATKRESDFWTSIDTFGLYKKSSQVGAYISSNQGVCKGDSGGPLVYDNNGVTTQYGVVSYGMTPCAAGRTDVYARVDTFKSWIEDNS